MSLREEIHCFINKTDARELADKLSDEIISIFKKRIDEFIKQEDERAEDMIYDIDSYSSSYAVMILKKFKEMLK